MDYSCNCSSPFKEYVDLFRSRSCRLAHSVSSCVQLLLGNIFLGKLTFSQKALKKQY